MVGGIQLSRLAFCESLLLFVPRLHIRLNPKYVNASLSTIVVVNISPISCNNYIAILKLQSLRCNTNCQLNRASHTPTSDAVDRCVGLTTFRYIYIQSLPVPSPFDFSQFFAEVYLSFSSLLYSAVRHLLVSFVGSSLILGISSSASVCGRRPNSAVLVLGTV